MTDFPIHKAPDEMLLAKQAITTFKRKYPWKELAVGYAFEVKVTDVKLMSLQSLCYKMGKRMGRSFRVKRYGDSYAVARGPDPVSSEKPAMWAGKTAEEVNKE